MLKVSTSTFSPFELFRMIALHLTCIFDWLILDSGNTGAGAGWDREKITMHLIVSVITLVCFCKSPFMQRHAVNTSLVIIVAGSITNRSNMCSNFM